MIVIILDDNGYSDILQSILRVRCIGKNGSFECVDVKLKLPPGSNYPD